MIRILALMLCAVSMFGAGSVSQSISKLGSTDGYVVVFDWQGDAGNGTVPSTAARLNAANQDFQGWILTGVEFSPGTPAPSALYDVTITDGVGVDLLGGGGANLSASVPSASLAGEAAMPLNGTFTLNITNTSVASAIGRVLVYIQKPGSGSILIRSSSSGGGGSTAFSAITSGTNTTSTMVCGSGCSMSFSGSGVLDANTIRGTAWPSAVTMTEVGYLDGVTSAIQAQIDAKLFLSGGTMTGLLTVGQILIADSSEGTCDISLRGRVVMDEGGSGVADTFRICRKASDNNYYWTPII